MHSLVVLSGGMDSTALLHLYLASAGTDDRVDAVSFDYGQRHSKELEFAHRVTRRVGVDHHIIGLSDLGANLTSALTDPDAVIPTGHYAAPNMAATVVPNRNAIMLSAAWGLAVSKGADRIGTAVHAGDHPIYPDCRPEFIAALTAALSVGTDGYATPGLYIDAPFVRLGKHHIAALGSTLGVPWDLTWSCYQGGDLHCGECGTCVERQEAFALADCPDPTIYEVDPA